MGPSLNDLLKNHPSWKGFPLKDWQKSVEALSALSAEAVKTSAEFPHDLSSFEVISFEDSKQNSLLSDSGLAGKDAFDSLVLDRAQMGLNLTLSENGKPLAILLNPVSGSQWKAYNHQVHLKERVESSVFIGTNGYESTKGLASQRFQIHLEKNAKLNVLFSEPTSPQKLSHSFFDFTLEAGAELHFVELISGVEMGRNEVHVDLKGPGSHASVSGVHLLNGTQVYDSRIAIKHSSADSSSRQSFKCVVSDQAKSLFGGKIEILRDAQRVDAAQAHKALLISPNAKAFAYPDLEVMADDVKAGHGSSIGQMDKDQIFYLKSRGLSEHESLRLLGEAFVRDALMKSSSKVLRDLSERILNSILPKFIQGMEDKMRQDS